MTEAQKVDSALVVHGLRQAAVALASQEIDANDIDLARRGIRAAARGAQVDIQSLDGLIDDGSRVNSIAQAMAVIEQEHERRMGRAGSGVGVTGFAYAIGLIGDEIGWGARRVHRLFDDLDALPRWRVLKRRRCRREIERRLACLDDLGKQRDDLIRRHEALNNPRSP